MIPYTSLSPSLFVKTAPEPVSAPRLLLFNEALREQLSLPQLPSSTWTAILSGNEPYPNQEAYSLAYAGHQYGRFTMLGDGRAHLIAELTSQQKIFDIQLKGSGKTPYSRGGDGRAVVGPMLREYVISEYMAAVGIPTTRSLGVVATGEVVYRETPLPGAIVARIADSHIRVGTFQYAALKGEDGLVQALADYSIQRHYPELVDQPYKYRQFLQAVIKKQASLVAKWMSIGFVHGVMNTDNMAISGQTIDYGPCAFLDTYKPEAVFSSIDRGGRYAYHQQPNIALWNVTRFAETLISLLDENSEKAIQMAEEDLALFSTYYFDEYYQLMGNKLGIALLDKAERIIVDRLLDIMKEEQLDYTDTFVQLTQGSMPSNSEEMNEWMMLWQKRLGTDQSFASNLMKQSNPRVIPRNQLLQEALDQAEAGNMDLLERILVDLQHPFEEPKEARLHERRNTDEPFVTYCGT